MNRYSFISIIVLSILLFSRCDKNNNADSGTLVLGDTISLMVDEKVENYQENISLKLDSIVNDSRCPTNVTCIWEGNAEAKFTFTNDNVDHGFILNTNLGTNFRKDTLIDNYNISLIQLYPYPENPGIIEQKDYFAEILLTKI